MARKNPAGQDARVVDERKRASILPIVLDIQPEEMTTSMFRNIEQEQIATAADLEDLFVFLWERPEVDTYLFWPKGTALNELIVSAEQTNRIQSIGFTANWYAHPNFLNDFIRIGRNPPWDSQREVREKQPMLLRAELRLTEHEKHRRTLAATRREIQAIFNEGQRPKTGPMPAQPSTEAAERAERSRRGPTPGEVDRYTVPDRALFYEMERMIREQHISSTEAARLLSQKIQGRGSEESRVKRLAGRYRRKRSKLAATR